MTERPLDERPAARPIDLPSAGSSAAQITPPKSGDGCLIGCIWIAIAIFLLIILVPIISVVGASISASSSSSSSSIESDNPITEDTENAPAPPSVSVACMDSMRTAASVPGSQSNDAEMEATLSSCTTLSEWTAALYANPATVGVVDQLAIEITLGALCNGGNGAPVCNEARSAGIIG